jgi:hypothetical protein
LFARILSICHFLILFYFISYDNSSYDVCAQGSVGCLFSNPEPINCSNENYEAQSWLLTQDPNSIIAFVIPGTLFLVYVLFNFYVKIC